VLNGEAVPAGPHADIMVGGRRQVQYGHKLNLASGKSGLIFDVVVENGNPADAERGPPMLDRHIGPGQAAWSG
jgi:IS5 family transposase